jgi:hypothetical protein
MKSIKFTMLMLALAIGLLNAQPTIRLDVQSNIGSLKGQTLVKVMIKDVVNLDTYSFAVLYDTAQCILKYADIAAPMININNCLQDGTRNILPVVKKEPGAAHVSATVAGDAPTGAIKDECVIGVLLLAPKAKNAPLALTLDKVTLLDNKRNRIADVIILNPGSDKGN